MSIQEKYKKIPLRKYSYHVMMEMGKSEPFVVKTVYSSIFFTNFTNNSL